jgi:hypothetical protein
LQLLGLAAAAKIQNQQRARWPDNSRHKSRLRLLVGHMASDQVSVHGLRTCMTSVAVLVVVLFHSAHIALGHAL